MCLVRLRMKSTVPVRFSDIRTPQLSPAMCSQLSLYSPTVFGSVDIHTLPTAHLIGWSLC
jgi:hypothetical protein